MGTIFSLEEGLGTKGHFQRWENGVLLKTFPVG